ncbi:uncharacterized protein LOC123722262 isoform X2 [Papilio machaon]|uniref:uncharacterized protein LOC123722262 isoform X2 n=1 Tax=Papilio machaon TaxID=76193 RepID=UPI001E6641AC|nr:uncharacterized protein LOC123722262 isoform X2 [Papilio machaon]
MILNIKGDLENITKRQLKFICDVISKQKNVVNEVIIENVGEKGDNYGSQVKRINVQFENGKEFKMIAKVRPDIMKIENETVKSVFINEIVMFNEVLPKFKELQENACVPKEDLFKYPHCYGTLDERDNEIILLEDLSVSNFFTSDKLKPLDNNTVKLVLNNIANMHSLSYVLGRKEPQLFNKILDTLFHPLFHPDNMTQSRILLENIAKDFDAIFETSRYRNIIVDVMQNFVNATMKLISSDKKSKYSVIQHGDLWTNNIMFQIQDNQPSMCTFIDYQLSRDSLPVSDIIYFVFNCTDYKTRLNHYHKWMDFYHSELDRHLSYFDLKVEDVYPRQKFDADLKRYAKAGLVTYEDKMKIFLEEISD